MHIDKNLIKNKQRILIGGTHGVAEIQHIIKTVVNHIHKPADFVDLSEAPHLTDAPTVIMIGGDGPENGNDLFNELNIHILLIHQLNDFVPAGYASFNEYVDQFEKLADALPKAGTFLYNEADDVALMIGKKEREDVKNIEYSAIDAIEGVNSDPEFLGQAGAAKALLKRIGVSESQFIAGLKTL
jgi:UDP-N-acetylmuramate: L-alanyl-gamma-D-glutamyl-meso-diaminopimelate ligase